MIEIIENEDARGKFVYVAVTNGDTTTVMLKSLWDELEAQKELGATL